jgi:hypothetical protein
MQNKKKTEIHTNSGLSWLTILDIQKRDYEPVIGAPAAFQPFCF